MGEGTPLAPMHTGLGNGPTLLAEVETSRASAYLLQLCKHFRHKRVAIFDEGRGEIEFDGARCLLIAVGGTLLLRVEGAERPTVGRIADVLGSHLERFGRRDHLQVRWHPPSA